MEKNRQGKQKKYIGWIHGAEGQNVLTEVGYFPYKLKQ
jgi:hypothetical protein